MYQTDPDFVDFVSQEIDGYEKVYWIYWAIYSFANT